jgi:hypothetical protein
MCVGEESSSGPGRIKTKEGDKKFARRLRKKHTYGFIVQLESS